jgi:RNA polymerase sigma factor (sigma-70 family)
VEELRHLLERTLAGDPEAFGEVISRFQDMVFGAAYATLGDFHLAEDAAQEAFITAYRELSKLRNLERFPGWLRRIVLSECHRIRRRRREGALPLEAATPVPFISPEPLEAAEKKEMKDKVLRAIKSLSEANRMATTLFYINGYSHKEIADFLEIPVGTVKRRLYDSRKKLKERMMAMVEEELPKKALPEDFSRRVKVKKLRAYRLPSISIVASAADLGGVELPSPEVGQTSEVAIFYPDSELNEEYWSSKVEAEVKFEGHKCFQRKTYVEGSSLGLVECFYLDKVDDEASYQVFCYTRRSNGKGRAFLDVQSPVPQFPRRIWVGMKPVSLERGMGDCPRAVRLGIGSLEVDALEFRLVHKYERDGQPHQNMDISYYAKDGRMLLRYAFEEAGFVKKRYDRVAWKSQRKDEGREYDLSFQVLPVELLSA